MNLQEVINTINSKPSVTDIQFNENFISIWFKAKSEDIFLENIFEVVNILKEHKELLKDYVKVEFDSLPTNQLNQKGTSVGYIFVDRGELWFKNQKIKNEW